MYSLFGLRGIVGLGIFFFLSALAYAVERYVPNQYQAIQTAIDDSNNGDVVIVSAGRYYENINFKGKNITVQSQNPDDASVVASTVIDGSRPVNPDAASVVTFKTGETRAAVLRGFTITGGSGTKPNKTSLGGGGIYCYNASPTISRNNIVFNIVTNRPGIGNTGAAIWVRSGYPLVYKNSIAYNSTPNTGGAISGGGVELLNNTIFNNQAIWDGGAIYLRATSIIKDNLIFSNQGGNSSSGIYLRGANNSVVVGNTLFRNSAILCGSNLDIQFCDNVVVYNNIICNGLNSPGIYFYQNTNITFKYNNVWNNSAGNYSGLPDQTGTNGNISIDPLFVRPDANDFHLQPVSTCINMGDSQYVADVNETDIDGNARILSGRVDIGADEFKDNRAPTANAGHDQTFGEIPPEVSLDGSCSNDPENDKLRFRWRQVSGPSVALTGPTTANPTFTTRQFGIYVFELIVNDGEVNSLPDKVGIVIGDKTPIANAGKDKYVIGDTMLDGRGSYDPDGYGQLSYQWQQTSGATTVTISGADSAEPLVSGFVQTSSIQKYEFKLVVSDGVKTSKPDTVAIIVVPQYGSVQLTLLSSFFDPSKPTIVGFDGGNCVSGTGMNFGSGWSASVNWLSVTYSPPYDRYGDALIVYLNGVAPDYKQPIETIGHSTGNMPAIDSAVRINSIYKDPRYTVNHVTLLDASCRGDYSSSIQAYLQSAVKGEQCWVENLYSTNSRLYPNVLNIQFPVPPAVHSTPWYWYSSSLYPSDIWATDEYNNGLTAGAFLSVIGKGKNFQLSNTGTYYAFKWVGNLDADGGTFSPGYLIHNNQSAYPGKILSPITLTGSADGNTVDANGAVLSCQPSQNAVKYQLLMGPDPYTMNLMICETNQPPQICIGTFPYETTYWTIKAYDQFGSSIFADPICIKAVTIALPISNPLGKEYLTCTGYEIIRQKRLSRTEFEYCFRMKVKNLGFSSLQKITMDLNSVPDNMTVLNDKVHFSSIPAQHEVLSNDTFTVRIDRRYPSDENDIIWQISNKLEGDFSGDDKIDLADLAILIGNWLQTGSDISVDLYKDQAINLVDLAIFAEHWQN
jgi:hypothetical protein